MPLRYILTAQLIRLPQLRGSVVTGTDHTVEAQSETIQRILTERNDTLQLCVGGKLTNFRGHKKITENHESFYTQNFLAVL